MKWYNLFLLGSLLLLVCVLSGCSSDEFYIVNQVSSNGSTNITGDSLWSNSSTHIYPSDLTKIVVFGNTTSTALSRGAIVRVNGNFSLDGESDRFIIGGPTGTNRINMYNSSTGGFNFYPLSTSATSTFNGPLHVNGLLSASSFSINYLTIGTTGNISGGSAFKDNAQLVFYDSNNGGFEFRTGKRLAGSDFRWYTGYSTLRMVLLDTGNVGINVSNPLMVLDVGGNTFIRGNLTINDTILIGTNAGITKTLNITNSTGTNCTIIFTKGIYTGGTC